MRNIVLYRLYFLVYRIEPIPTLIVCMKVYSCFFIIGMKNTYSSLQATLLSLLYRVHTDLNCKYASIQFFFLYYLDEEYSALQAIFLSLL